MSGSASEHPPLRPPARIVSLVPSLTESLFELGLGERVVGVTDWCVHPADAVATLPKVGGTKDPNIEAIASLRPDLVIANHEENTRRSVAALVAGGLDVWVTYPRTVQQGVELLEALAEFGSDAAERQRARAVAAPVRAAFERARAASRSIDRRPRVFCPIWRDPWMAVGADTYAHDLIALSGGDNICADFGDRRYPKVQLEDLLRARPEVILLPDEPYEFGQRDADELATLDWPAAHHGRIHLIDGTLVSWYGPRIRPAIAQLRLLFAAPPS